MAVSQLRVCSNLNRKNFVLPLIWLDGEGAGRDEAGFFFFIHTQMMVLMLEDIFDK